MGDTAGGTRTYAREEVFRSYDARQAEAYAAARPDYCDAFWQYILDHHASTGGENELVIDLGTGHGNVVRAMAPHFERAIGADPSEGMLGVAQRLSRDASVRTKDGREISFVTGAAEQVYALDGVQEGMVDMIVAGTAAHWFDMPRFWPAAARALKPNGTVALFVLYNVCCHPTQPHNKQLQPLLDHMDQVTLDPYMLPGNRMVRDGYTTLECPFELPADNLGYSAFPRDRYCRKDWNRGGECRSDEEFFNSDREVLPEHIGRAIATASPLTRWRLDEKNRQAIQRGEIRDCVEALVDKLRDIVGKGEGIRLGLQTALLLFKRI